MRAFTARWTDGRHLARGARRVMVVSLLAASLACGGSGLTSPDGGSAGVAFREIRIQPEFPLLPHQECRWFVVRSEEEWSALGPRHASAPTDFAANDVIVLWATCQPSCSSPASPRITSVTQANDRWVVEAERYFGCPIDCDGWILEEAYYEVPNAPANVDIHVVERRPAAGECP